MIQSKENSKPNFRQICHKQKLSSNTNHLLANKVTQWDFRFAEMERGYIWLDQTDPIPTRTTQESDTDELLDWLLGF